MGAEFRVPIYEKDGTKNKKNIAEIQVVFTKIGS